MAHSRSRIRSMEAVARNARNEALLEAADAWDALTPQERHTFTRRYAASIRFSSLPAMWLRVRAHQEQGREDVYQAF